MLAGHTVLETARDSLFLARLSVQQLPWTYGAIAVAALLATELNARLRTRLAPGRLLLWGLWAGALGDVAFIIPLRAHVSWAPHAFYVFIAVVATLATSQFWLLVSELFTVLEAKRSLAAISTGGLLGAMLGAALARWVGPHFGDIALLYVGAGLLVLSGVLAVVARTDAGETYEPKRQSGPPLPAAVNGDPLLPAAVGQEVASEREALRYLRRILWLGLISTVTATLVDYLFKVQVTSSVPKAQLNVFFANFNAGANAFALVLQLLLAPRLLTQSGIGRSLAFVPLVLFGLLSTVFAVPALWSAILLRSSDSAMRYSLLRSSLEVLYLPLTRPVRARWKMLVDLIGQRGGQVLASIIILGFISAGLSVRQMAVIVVPVTVGWLWLALRMESKYIALFRARVKAGAIETRSEVPALDLRSLESLIVSLGSEDDDEVLATIMLLVDYDLAHMIPALLLYHPSRQVVLRTLAVFSNAHRRDHFGAARRLLTRDDDELRAAAMVSLAGHMSDEELSSELAKSPPLAVCAALTVALAARDETGQSEAAREVRASCEVEAGYATRLAYARALRLWGGSLTRELAPRLLVQSDPAIELEVAKAMRASPWQEHLPYLVNMLVSRQVRSIARDTLVAIGMPALEALQRASSDPHLSRRIRAHVPRSVARFNSDAAADLLLDMLERESDGWVRFKVVRALGLLRERVRSSSARMARVHAVARAHLEQALHYMSARLDLASDPEAGPHLALPGGRLLAAALADKETFAIDRAVRLAGLRHRADAIHNIRQALAGSDPRLRADSVELLVHRAPSDLAQALTALLAHDEDELRLFRAATALSFSPLRARYAERLEQLTHDSSETVCGIAAFHARELGLSLRMAPPPAPTLQRVSGVARELLAAADRWLDSARPKQDVLNIRRLT